MTVIVIYEDNHGMIGIAKDYESAINFLLQNHWLDSEFEIMDENYKWVALKDLNVSIGNIRQMDIDKFNKFFDGCFYLDIDTVWGM